jgi:hypothetical protein
MNTDKIYQDTMAALTMLVTQHVCPDGSASIRAFCKAYGIGRQNLTACLACSPGQTMSVGVYLRVLVALGLINEGGPSPSGHALRSPISLREYLEIDNTIVTRGLLAINFS